MSDEEDKSLGTIVERFPDGSVTIRMTAAQFMRWVVLAKPDAMREILFELLGEDKKTGDA